MIGLLVFKEKLRMIYGKYDIYILLFVKFLLGFVSFFLLNQNIGYMTKLKSPAVPLVMGLICAFLPYGGIAFLSGVFMLAHLYSVSPEFALIVLIFLLIMGILYYGFQPGDSYLLLLTPILFYLKIPYAVPLLVGLSGSLFSVIPVSCGVVIYYILQYVKQNAGVLTNDASVDITQKYVQIVNVLVTNRLMMVMIGAFAVGILVVYIIRSLSVDYAWLIAIVAGAVAQLSMIFIGDFLFDVSAPVGELLIGVIASVMIAGIYDFFVFAVDYSRTEYIQYEDDDYHYYVKAVPKIIVSAPDVKVQKINPKKAQKNS